MDMDVLTEVLDEAVARACQIVNFSGGEPFILGHKLVEMISAASARGLRTRITTGAYWSSSAAKAAQRLKPLAEAGLNQLFISSSDSHQQFVSFANVVQATSAARKYGIEVYLALGTSKTSLTGIRTAVMEFEKAGVAIPWMVESPIIPFGRAEENIASTELRLQSVANFAGPCSSLTENPTVRPDGQITGCAVVFGEECPPLSFGRINQASFASALDRMDSNPLAQWIHKVGVVELKRLIEEVSPIRFPDSYVNICHLCGDILSNPEALGVLDELGMISLAPETDP